MTKKHHPSNRRERLWIKEIKDAKKGKTGRLRRKDETEENGYGLEGLEVPRPEETQKEELQHQQLERVGDL